eukprot:3941423-Rhodomonas_salina.2
MPYMGHVRDNVQVIRMLKRNGDAWNYDALIVDYRLEGKLSTEIVREVGPKPLKRARDPRRFVPEQRAFAASCLPERRWQCYIGYIYYCHRSKLMSGTNIGYTATRWTRVRGLCPLASPY